MRLLDAAIATNTRLGITGILFFDKGHFGQILEGNRAAVEGVWGNIQKDVRHHDIELLGTSKITERRFSKWAMKLFSTQEFVMNFPKFSKAVIGMTDQDLEARRTLSSMWFPA